MNSDAVSSVSRARSRRSRGPGRRKQIATSYSTTSRISHGISDFFRLLFTPRKPIFKKRNARRRRIQASRANSVFSDSRTGDTSSRTSSVLTANNLALHNSQRTTAAARSRTFPSPTVSAVRGSGLPSNPVAFGGATSPAVFSTTFTRRGALSDVQSDV